MKKVYLLGLLAITAASSSFAQTRTIDWEVDTILSPFELVSNEQTGSPFKLHVVMKNNGPDAAEIGDTMLFYFLIRKEDNTPWFRLPSVNGLYYLLLFRDVPSGDTVHVNLNLGFSTLLYNSTNIKIQVNCELVNRRAFNDIKLETTATLANNSSTRNIVWWNAYRNGIGIEDFKSNQLLSVYPNPATKSVNIAWNVRNIGSTETVISIRDLQGRLVMEQSVSPISSSEILDVSALNKGMYLVEIRNGEFRTTQKLQVTN